MQENRKIVSTTSPFCKYVFLSLTSPSGGELVLVSLKRAASTALLEWSAGLSTPATLWTSQVLSRSECNIERYSYRRSWNLHRAPVNFWKVKLTNKKYCSEYQWMSILGFFDVCPCVVPLTNCTFNHPSMWCYLSTLAKNCLWQFIAWPPEELLSLKQSEQWHLIFIHNYIFLPKK